MAKSKSPTNTPVPVYQKPEGRIQWPQTPKDICDLPRRFRIQRLNSFEWQAYVLDSEGETAIGKPDLFDILTKKVAAVMRAEGQKEFLANKNPDPLLPVKANV